MIWLNGQLIAEDEASIPFTDRGFLLGDGLFETLLAIKGQAINAAAHWDRLMHGSDILELPLSFSRPDLDKASSELLSANGLSEGRASIRLTVSRGSGQRGLSFPEPTDPLYIMTAADLPTTATTLDVVTSSIRRNEHSPLSQLKTTNYLDNILAKREAALKGASEALMLNTKGNVACLTIGNIWMIKDQTLLTPKLSDGVLAGTVREQILNGAEKLGYTAKETTITPEQIKKAEELFMSNSLVTILPIDRLDGQHFPTERSKALLSKFRP